MSDAKLSDQAVDQRLKSLPDWKRTGGEIAKTYNFKNYYETMAFVNAIAWIAHAADHHPDLEVGYNKCRVRYSTHSAGGVTENDIDAAANVEGLLRKSI